MGISVHHLRWSDFAAPLAAFDPEPARRIATALLHHPPARLNDEKRRALGDAIDRRLLAAYGPWVAGWTWAASEPGGGGPVRGWCCAPHSLLSKRPGEPAASVERVVGAVAEWRAFLVELKGRFGDLRRASADRAVEDAVEFAAARLLPFVIERTDAEDAWYQTFARIVSWFLEDAGHDADRVGPLVGAALGGRFASWTAPDERTAQAVCADVGRLVAAGETGKPEVAPDDALERWLALRGGCFGDFPARDGMEPAPADGHRAFIAGPEHGRDPERAARMSAALDACRASALRDEPLDLARLTDWQALVLGVRAAPCRTTDAFAKGGRERYGTLGGALCERLTECLAEATDTAVPVAVRAARAYLDVSFFHPFSDGNARAARLALDHVLTRAGLALFSAEPVFLVSRAASDRWAAAYLAWVVDHLSGRSPPR
jgi:hypothetical protein